MNEIEKKLLTSKSQNKFIIAYIMMSITTLLLGIFVNNEIWTIILCILTGIGIMLTIGAIQLKKELEEEEGENDGELE